MNIYTEKRLLNIGLSAHSTTKRRELVTLNLAQSGEITWGAY